VWEEHNRMAASSVGLKERLAEPVWVGGASQEGGENRLAFERSVSKLKDKTLFVCVGSKKVLETGGPTGLEKICPYGGIVRMRWVTFILTNAGNEPTTKEHDACNFRSWTGCTGGR